MLSESVQVELGLRLGKRINDEFHKLALFQNHRPTRTASARVPPKPAAQIRREFRLIRNCSASATQAGQLVRWRNHPLSAETRHAAILFNTDRSGQPTRPGLGDLLRKYLSASSRSFRSIEQGAVCSVSIIDVPSPDGSTIFALFRSSPAWAGRRSYGKLRLHDGSKFLDRTRISFSRRAFGHAKNSCGFAVPSPLEDMSHD
jgi:hypothetical protein